jgi:signal transduction histidine kinase
MELIGRVGPHVLLGISVTLAVLTERPWRGLAVTLGVAAAAAAWSAWWVTLHPGWARRPVLMRVYFTGLIAVSAVLIARTPWFAFFAFTGVMAALYLFHGAWRYAGVAAAAVLVAICQAGGYRRPDPGYVVVIVVLAAVQSALYLAFGLAGEKGDERLRRRGQMIAELAEANRRLEETLAEKAGLQAQLLTQAREAGISAERQRMAREIHDTLAQGLTGIITQLQAAQQAAGEQAEWRRHLDAAAALARRGLADARRSVTAMRPQALEHARLPEALAEEAARWSAITGVKAEVTTTGGARPLHPEIEVTLLRAAQEALANVGKHADASRVALTLSYMEDVVTLDVRDDGRGFPPVPASTGRSGGFGLEAMRQRLGSVAGTLEIESGPGAGTALCASVPAIGVGTADD